MEKYPGIRKRIAEAKEGRRETIYTLASKMGVTPSAVSHMQNRGISNRPTIEALARALNVRIEWLLTGEGLMDCSGPSDVELQKLFEAAQQQQPAQREAIKRMLEVMLSLSASAVVLIAADLLQAISRIQYNAHTFRVFARVGKNFTDDAAAWLLYQAAGLDCKNMYRVKKGIQSIQGGGSTIALWEVDSGRFVRCVPGCTESAGPEQVYN